MKKHLPIILILLLAAALRFIQLGKNPPGLYWDEVSLGYNAYSILKTGKDEHGEFLPLARFKAFGDYKPPGYIYATVPSIALFGLNNFAVRFPSALAGVVMVWLTYLLVKELKIENFKLKIAELAALILAISPWHLQLSRVAFESMLAACFNLAAVYFFIKAIHKKPYHLILSAVFFVLTLYTFNSNRLLTPLLLIVLSLIYFKGLWQIKRPVIIAALIGIILSLPLIPYLRSPESKVRWHEVNIFSNLDLILTANQRIASDANSRIAKLLHHRYLGHATNFLSHYFDHFEGKYLFITGDGNRRFSTQSTGQLYLIEIPLLLFGFYFLLTSKSKTAAAVLLAWFFLGSIPSATARETPHALRSLSGLPSPQIIIALGILQLIKVLKTRPQITLAIVVGLYTFSFLKFQYIYYRYSPQEFASEWLTQYPPLVNYLRSVESDYDKIYVTSEYNRPYIYFLFYSQFDPATFQAESTTTRTGDAFGFFDVHQVGKYIFDQPDWLNPQPNTLYVTGPGQPPPGYQLITVISGTDHQNYFSVANHQ